jgi:hypothetical protein
MHYIVDQASALGRQLALEHAFDQALADLRRRAGRLPAGEAARKLPVHEALLAAAALVAAKPK